MGASRGALRSREHPQHPPERHCRPQDQPDTSPDPELLCGSLGPRVDDSAPCARGETVRGADHEATSSAPSSRKSGRHPPQTRSRRAPLSGHRPELPAAAWDARC